MQTIYLDIANKGVIPCIQAKQSEVGRKFLAVITDNGVPYNIPNDALLSVWYEGDTDAGNYSSIEEKSAFSIDANKVTVELVAQMLLKPGKGELCLSITHGDGGETNTWNIPYNVEYKPGAGSAVPTEYYTALTEAGAIAAEQVGLARQQADLAKEFADRAEQTVDGYLKSDGSVSMSGALNMGGNQISNVADPDIGNPSGAVNVGTMQSMLNIIVPIGYTFYWSPVDEFDIDLSTPEKVAAHYGFGVWEQIKDKFLFACGENIAVGENGGAYTHSLTTDEMPEHRHSTSANIDQSGSSNIPAGQSRLSIGSYIYSTSEVTEKGGTILGNTGIAGLGKEFDIMPPYLAVYVWKRIA